MDRRNYLTCNFASHNKVMHNIPLQTHTPTHTDRQLKPLHILIASAKNIFNFNRLTSCCCCCCCCFFPFLSICRGEKRVKIVRQKGQMQMENAEKRPKEQQQLGNKPFTLLGRMSIHTYSMCMYVCVCVCILIQRPNSSHNGNTSPPSKATQSKMATGWKMQGGGERAGHGMADWECGRWCRG